MTHNSGKETRTNVYVSVDKTLQDGSSSNTSFNIPVKALGKFKKEIYEIAKFIAGTFNIQSNVININDTPDISLKLPELRVLKRLFSDKTLSPDITDKGIEEFEKLMSCFTEGKITEKGIQKATSLLVGKE